MTAALLVCCALTAADSDQRALLKTFRQEFVAVTPGKGKFPKSFVMGGSNAKPAHEVTLQHDFHIARYEVPQNLWEAVMEANPSRWKGPRNSVEMLSLAEAHAFCKKATERMRHFGLIRPDQRIRLPSEAEWEYVARAGTTTTYSFGDTTKARSDHAWFTGNASGNDPPVGAKKPNPWGLYDIHGYLWEWCSDHGHKDYQGAPTDGSSWEANGSVKEGVLRGGSWKDTAERLASGYRRIAAADLRDDAVGLRCVLDRDPGVQPPAAFVASAQSTFVPAGSVMELLWDGGDFTEGPALAPDGAILFSDIGHRIMRYDPKSGETTVYREQSGKANGLMFDDQGRLIACEGAKGGNRRISITDADGKLQMHADDWQGKRFNSPNDLAIRAGDQVYFTDPRYAGDEPRELDFEGVFRVDLSKGVDLKKGNVFLATKDVQKPNGIAFSKDGSAAYVADNNPLGKRQLLKFSVADDGSLVDKHVLHDFGSGRGVDGMTTDADGNIYATAGSGYLAGIYVFSPDGKPLAFIPTPGDPTNCAFGGGDQSTTLYITAAAPASATGGKASYGLYAIKLSKGR